jgi:hypothetical protein
MKKQLKEENVKVQDDETFGNIYEFFGVTDSEILLLISKRKEENKALKKLLGNLSSNPLRSKLKK